jgi:lysophospholipase L1-like esterase
MLLGENMTDHSSKDGRGISRRGLLQGAAVTVGGFALAGAGASSASAATKPFIPSGLTYSANDPLAGFFRKVAAGTATIVTAGDSITEAFGAPTPQEGYPARLRARLRNGAGQAPGGLDYIPARYQYATLKTPPKTGTYVSYAGAGGVPIDIRSTTYARDLSTKSGLGRRAVALTSARIRSLSFTQRFTSFVLSWRGSTSPRDTVSVTIDGTKVTLPAVSSGEQTWTSPRLSSATRTVTVTWESGTPFVEGWQLFDGDEGGGFHVLESSQSESTTAGFSLASSATNGDDTWADALRRTDPDLITSMWGTNDYGRVTPAVLTQQTVNYLDLVHGRAPEAALLVVMPYQLGGASSAEWAKYRAAQQQAVTTFRSANPGVAIGFFDLGPYVPPYFGQTGAADNPYMSDGIHPNRAGYDVIAAILYAYLTSKPA